MTACQCGGVEKLTRAQRLIVWCSYVVSRAFPGMSTPEHAATVKGLVILSNLSQQS